MKIVVSGATGYLGSKISERFCSEGHSVLALARTKSSELASMQKRYGSVLKVCELRTEELFFCLSAFNPDVIFSTTCCYETDAKCLNKTVDSNYSFPALLLRYAVSLQENFTKQIRFVSIGTSLPGNLNLYSLTKKHFCELGRFFSDNGKIQFVNVPLESFYGIDEPANRFIKSCVIRLLRNENLEVTEGTQHRDYVFVNDVVDILCFLALSKKMKENFYSIPVGSGTAPAIREILDYLADKTVSKSKIIYGAKSMRKNEPSTCADLSALRTLGYDKPLVGWKDGMKMMVDKISLEESKNENID